MEGGDVPAAKYQKLAQAYSDLKTKNSVLKAAVKAGKEAQAQLEAQLSSALAAAAKPAGPPANSAEQQRLTRELRSSKQELDTLAFRNQQLTKRFEVLQGELEAARKAGGRGGGKSAKKAAAARQEQAQQLQEEELHRKIRENETLHAKLQQQQKNHQADMGKLRATLADAQSRLQEEQRDTANRSQDLQANVLSLNTNNIRLQQDLDAARQELMSMRAQASHLERESSTTKEQVLSTVADIRKEFQTKVFFNDTAHARFNALNLPVTDTSTPEKRAGVLKDIESTVRDVASHLNAFFARFSERARTLMPVMQEEPVFMTLASRLASCSLVTSPFGLVFKLDAVDTATGQPLSPEAALQGAQLGEDVLGLAQFFKDLSDLQGQVTVVVNGMLEGSQTLQATNASIAKSLVQVTEVMEAIGASLTQYAKADLSEAVGDLSTSLAKLHVALKTLCTQYTSKMSLEQRVELFSGARAVNEGITSSLTKLAMSSAKLASLVADNQMVLGSGSGFLTRGAAVDQADLPRQQLELLTERAARYMASLNRPAPPSVSYDDALQNLAGGASAEEMEAVQVQLKQAQAQARKLEQDKEHFKLECELMKIKLSKGGRSNTQEPPSNEDSQPEALTEEERGREELIKKHYLSRINQLTAQVQFADSKAVAFYDECRAMALRLEDAVFTQRQQMRTVLECDSKVSGLKEENEVTKRNYEEQLGAMTEHVMALNQQLATVKEQNSMLKHARTSKSSKRR